MSAVNPEHASGEPSEAELRAAYEQEIKQIRVEQVLLEHVVTLINLGMRRTGLAPGTEGERDPAQVMLAVEAVRSLLGLIEQIAPDQVKPIRDALAQLQMAYVRIGGQAASAEPAPATGAAGASPSGAPADSGGPSASDTGPTPGTQPPSGDPEAPGPAQRSGRLWIPGQ